MGKVVKCVCENCAEVNFKSRKEVFFHTFFSFFAIIGILAVLLLVFFGSSVWAVLNRVLFLGLADNADPFFDARGFVRDYVDYDGRDSYETVYSLLAFMPRIDYVPASFYQGINGYRDTLVDGSDCKNVATLFTKLMLDTGYSAVVDCSFKQGHCVSKVFYDGSNEDYFGTYMVVDLTCDCVSIYDFDVDHWNNNIEPLRKDCFIK